MKLSTILRDLDTTALDGSGAVDVTGVTCDSRQVRPGFLFVAIPGHACDGWTFIPDALGRGARTVIAEAGAETFRRFVRGRDIPATVSFLQVPDSKAALATVAATFHGHPSRSLTTVGITGTNGKTTTAYLVRDVLRAAGKAPGMLTTVTYEVGARSIPAVRTTPDAPTLQAALADMIRVGCQSAVLEVSSHAVVQQRIGQTSFDVAVFTNLTRDHLDYHGSMEEYFEAKAGLFAEGGGHPAPGTAVINTDDAWGRQLAQRDLPSHVVTYGTQAGADVRASDIAVTPSGCRFHVGTPWGEADCDTRLLGRFNISNILAAMAAGGSLGIDPTLMARVLSAAECVPGRLELVSTDRAAQIFVDYAHTDDALKHVLQTLREITTRRLFVVFGCGGDRDKSKRPAMGQVAEQLADYSIITSDNPRTEPPLDILREIETGFTHGQYEVLESRRDAIHRAIEMAGEGDVVLIAGKGHENFQEFANKTVPFDDRQVALEAGSVSREWRAVC